MENLDMNDPVGSMMSMFRLSQVLSSLVFTVIGIYLFRYGKRVANVKLCFIAVTMMAYQMFTPNWMWDWGVGIALGWLAYYVDQNESLTG